MFNLKLIFEDDVNKTETDLGAIYDMTVQSQEYYIAWVLLSYVKNLPEDFIEKYIDYLDMDKVQRNSALSFDFIERHTDLIDWDIAPQNPCLVNENNLFAFLMKFHKYMDCTKISKNYYISRLITPEQIDALAMNGCELNWEDISTYCVLDEAFMRKWHTKLNMSIISKEQELSEDFMLDFKDELDWVYIAYYQEYSPEFEKAMASYLSAADTVQTSFSQEQLQEIQLAKDHGIDPSIFADTRFSALQMHEIRIGLEGEIHAGLYIDARYSPDQMRMLRQAMERGTNVTKAANPNFTWEQMWQIISGIEEGVDVDSYADTVYNANQMAAKKCGELRNRNTPKNEESKNYTSDVLEGFNEYMASASEDEKEISEHKNITYRKRE